MLVEEEEDDQEVLSVVLVTLYLTFSQLSNRENLLQRCRTQAKKQGQTKDDVCH